VFVIVTHVTCVYALPTVSLVLGLSSRHL